MNGNDEEHQTNAVLARPTFKLRRERQSSGQAAIFVTRVISSFWLQHHF